MKKIYFLLLMVTFAFVGNKTIAQTVLVPGDIGIIWVQSDTPDDFAFITYVNLDAGTVIYFTDCGVVPSGSFDPLGCTEGAFAYTVPAGGHAIGEVFTLANTMTPTVPGNPNFSTYNDVLITGSMGISTGGDQVIVFQAAGFPGGAANASLTPSFIFILNLASTLFTGDDSNSTTETGLPAGLQDTVAPVTALGLGSGPGPSDENDNAVYMGTYLHATPATAKLAFTNPANYYFTQTNPPGDATYNGHVAAIVPKITLSNDDFDFNSGIRMYPNPVADQLNFSIPSGLDLDVQVIDFLGKRIINMEKVSNGQSIDVSALKSGLYLVKMQSGDRSLVKKLIKR